MLNAFILCFAIIPMSYGSPVDKIEEKGNLTIPASNETLQINDNNITKMTVASEGGAITSNTPEISLPKENQAFFMASPADVSTNKVKPRKGAPLEESEGKGREENMSVEHNSVIGDTSRVPSPQPTIKKPTVLSAELLQKADLLNSDPAVDDAEERMVKIHKKNSNGHPELITPIVITVLVVPIFAMIGYMALKRGQEAWKNRHYKRMDFLLDGMYND